MFHMELLTHFAFQRAKDQVNLHDSQTDTPELHTQRMVKKFGITGPWKKISHVDCKRKLGSFPFTLRSYPLVYPRELLLAKYITPHVGVHSLILGIRLLCGQYQQTRVLSTTLKWQPTSALMYACRGYIQPARSKEWTFKKNFTSLHKNFRILQHHLASRWIECPYWSKSFLKINWNSIRVIEVKLGISIIWPRD